MNYTPTLAQLLDLARIAAEEPDETRHTTLGTAFSHILTPELFLTVASDLAPTEEPAPKVEVNLNDENAKLLKELDQSGWGRAFILKMSNGIATGFQAGITEGPVPGLEEFRVKLAQRAFCCGAARPVEEAQLPNAVTLKIEVTGDGDNQALCEELQEVIKTHLAHKRFSR